MTTKNKLVHPATVFIQSLSFNEVAFKDMTGSQQAALFDYMVCDGDGVWAETCATLDDAISNFGDVVFGVGVFDNDDVMKVAFVESTDGADTDNPLEWFAEHCICDDGDGRPFPVILNNASIAPDFGLFEWGFEWFYSYWAMRPQTEFIRFLPWWNSEDPSGRGGQ